MRVQWISSENTSISLSSWIHFIFLDYLSFLLLQEEGQNYIFQVFLQICYMLHSKPCSVCILTGFGSWVTHTQVLLETSSIVVLVYQVWVSTRKLTLMYFLTLHEAALWPEKYCSPTDPALWIFLLNPSGSTVTDDGCDLVIDLHTQIHPSWSQHNICYVNHLSIGFVGIARWIQTDNEQLILLSTPTACILFGCSAPSMENIRNTN